MLQRTKMTLLRLLAIIGFVVLFVLASISLASCSSDSKSVVGMQIGDDGHLYVTYSDSETPVDLGLVKSDDGVSIESVEYDEASQSLVITYSNNKTETVDVSALVGCDHLDNSGDDAYVYVCDVKAPTDCTKGDGLALYYCTECGNAIIREIPAAGHNYVDVVTKPTCTTQGYTTHTCSVCGDTYVDTYVDALGHTYNSGVVTTAATCTTDGVMTYTCTVCNGTLSGGSYPEAIPATGHNYDHTKDPAYVVVNGSNICENGGYYVYECENGCTVLEPVYVAPQDHQIDFTASTTVVTDPTTTTKGSIYGYCANCGEWVTITLPVLNDTDYVYTKGTITDCSLDRTDTYTYTYNGYDLVFEVVVPGGYHYVTVTYTDTNGATKTTDVRIDDTKVYTLSDYVPGTNNSVTYADIFTLTGNIGSCGYETDNDTKVEYTGNAWFNCDVCGTEVIVVEVVIPHTYDETKWTTVTEPTCTTVGYETNVCTVCGWVETREIEATGHNYTGYALKTDTLDATTDLYIAGTNYVTDSKGYYTAINYCLNCYDVYQEITVSDISETITKEATCNETGLKDITITLPDTTKIVIEDVVIPALGHMYNSIAIPDGVTIHMTADAVYYIDPDTGKTVVVSGTYNGTTVTLGTGVQAISWTGNSASGCATGSTGTVYYYCDTCGEVITHSAVTDHTFVTANGTTLTSGTTLYTDGVAEVLATDTTLTDVAATCTSTGVKYEYCTVCKEYHATTIAATDHTYAYALKTDTLDEKTGLYIAGTGAYVTTVDNNVTYYTVIEYCTVCGTYTTYTGTLTTEVTTAATCLTEGVQTNTITYTISGVSYTLKYTEVIPVTGHLLNEVEIDDSLEYYIGTAADGTHYAYYIDSQSVTQYVYQDVTDAQIASGEKKIMYITGNSSTSCDPNASAGTGYFICDNGAHGNEYVITIAVRTDHTYNTVSETTTAATATVEGVITTTNTCTECGTVTTSYTYVKPTGYTYTVTSTSVDSSDNLVVVLADENGKTVTLTISATATTAVYSDESYAASIDSTMASTGYTVTTTTGSCTEDATTTYTYSYVYTIVGSTSCTTYTYTESYTYVVTEKSSVGHVYAVDADKKEIVYTFSSIASDGYLHNYEAYKCTVCGQFILVSDEIDESYAAQAAIVTVGETKTVSLNSASTSYTGTLTIETEGYYAVEMTSTDAYITMVDSTGAYSWSNVSKLTSSKTVTASTDVSTYIVDAYGNPALIPAGTVFTVTVALYDQETTEVVSASFTVTSETYDDGTIAVTLGKTIDALDVDSVYSFTAPEDGTYYVASENDYWYGVYIYDNLDDATEGNYNYLNMAYQGSPYTIKLSEGQKIYIIPYDYAESQDLTITMKEKLVINYTEYSGTAYNVSDSTAEVSEYGSATVAAGDTINSVLVADSTNSGNLYIATEDSEYYELAIGSDTVVYEGVDLTYGLSISATTSSKYYGLILTVAESCDVTFYIGLNSSSSVFTITGSDGTVVKTISDENAAGSYTVLSYTVTLSAGTYTLTSTGSTTRLFAVAMDVESTGSGDSGSTTVAPDDYTLSMTDIIASGETLASGTYYFTTTSMSTTDSDDSIISYTTKTENDKTASKEITYNGETYKYYLQYNGASSESNARYLTIDLSDYVGYNVTVTIVATGTKTDSQVVIASEAIAVSGDSVLASGDVNTDTNAATLINATYTADITSSNSTIYVNAAQTIRIYAVIITVND